MKSTLFLNHITCVDHAYIDDSGRVVGGSYHPVFEISGDVEPNEQVVIDFSKVKNQVKQIIDDKVNGFDHKLWLIQDFSKYEYLNQGDHIKLFTNAVYLKMPVNAVKFVSSKGPERDMEAQVKRELDILHPNANIQVKCSLTEVGHTRYSNETAAWFRYVHGLKNSSSWGCQNHSHGHLSFMEFDFNEPKTDGEINDLSFQVQYQLDNTLFLFKDNVTHEDDDGVQISYETERGQFDATYSKYMNNIVILDTETTVENLVAWFVEKYSDLLASFGVTRVYMSEGLSKGAVLDI